MNFTLIFKNNKEIKSLANDNITIKDILNDMNLSSETVVAKKNGEIIVEDEKIQDGDEIQLIQIIYGGWINKFYFLNFIFCLNIIL